MRGGGTGRGLETERRGGERQSGERGERKLRADGGRMQEKVMQSTRGHHGFWFSQSNDDITGGPVLRP